MPGLIGVGGFAATFAEMGPCAVVAPLWSVKDKIAHEIAVDFYTKAKKDKSLPFAEILRRQRAKAFVLPLPKIHMRPIVFTATLSRSRFDTLFSRDLPTRLDPRITRVTEPHKGPEYDRYASFLRAARPGVQTSCKFPGLM